MSTPQASRIVPGLILGALSLLSAFLLFQVQPIISKYILPWFGGSPGVWTTCMLFFQIVLFAGYAYAHTLTLLPRKWQGVLHGLLLGAAIAMLPIAPGDAWKPTGEEDPALRILLLLLASVGLPYFVLSSTSPLVQVWFTRTTGGGNPWRLYALSNVGSLAALLSYPLFFEVNWDVVEQTTLWSVAFGAFVILSISGVWMDRTHAVEAASKPPEVIDTAADHPGWWRRGLWVLLPALASSVLLSATNHVCQDVAVIPFLWVVPLSLYLLTFIICFEHERWYARVPALWVVPALLVVFYTCTQENLEKTSWWHFYWMPNYLWELAWAFGAMFLACIICHGELTRLKPAPRRLTEFYLLMSAGGALGGLFVSLGAPRLFTTFAEWPISLILVFALATLVLLRGIWRVKSAWQWVIMGVIMLLMTAEGWWLNKSGALKRAKLEEIQGDIQTQMAVPTWVLGVTVAVIALCFLILAARSLRRGVRAALVSVLLLGVQFTVTLMVMCDLGFSEEHKLERVRNFYGMLSVTEDYDSGLGAPYRQLTNGAIIHGMQNLGEGMRDDPTTYYGHQTGIGKALDSIKDRPEARVGVVGMGAGTVSCYAEKGQTYRFYDINPDVVRIAQKHFTYLADLEARGATLQIRIADARLAMDHEPDQGFDVLLLDAFSGDSVPVHLLTLEAFAIYKRHMKPDGIIVVHITNRYLVLAPVISKIAAEMGYRTTRIATESDGGDHDSTDYMLLTNNESFLADTPEDLVGDEVELKHDVRLWTDRYHNLLRILDIPQNIVPWEEDDALEADESAGDGN